MTNLTIIYFVSFFDFRRVFQLTFITLLFIIGLSKRRLVNASINDKLNSIINKYFSGEHKLH